MKNRYVVYQKKIQRKKVIKFFNKKEDILAWADTEGRKYGQTSYIIDQITLAECLLDELSPDFFEGAK